jgi:hypothetical protein
LTKRELSQLYYLNREIERDKLRLQELRSAAEGTTTTLTGMPKGSMTSDKIARYAVEIAELEQVISLNIQRCWYEYNRLNRFIEEVSDSEIRQILSFRFVNGLSWQQVAANMGQYYTADMARMMANRFIQQS